MDTIHNPDRFMSDLRQILSQGRKRIGLLVGAGATIAIRVNQETGDLDDKGRPIIPGVDDLTKVVVGGLKDATQRKAAEAIRDGLGPSANIESILSRIRLLERALGKTKIDDLDGQGYADLGQTICDRIGAIVNVNLPRQRNAYNELVAWISGTSRTHGVEVFTTNYDLLFEEAFEQARAPYFDGFSGGNAPFFDPVTVAGDDLPSRWSRLWKMHGSLGWSLADSVVIRKQDRNATQLIYPDYLKYDQTQKQPYTALFERLNKFLLTPDSLLLVVGFSFRDAHITAALQEALAMNSNGAVFAFQYGLLKDEVAATKIALDRPNLSIYAADGAVINSVPGKWRPGELPKNWEEIRASFWTSRGAAGPLFVLGDFVKFARFCALAQASELQKTAEEVAAVASVEPDSNEHQS
jgi:hypothetical protein